GRPTRNHTLQGHARFNRRARRDGDDRRESNRVCGDLARHVTKGKAPPSAGPDRSTVHPKASGCTLATPVPGGRSKVPRPTSSPERTTRPDRPSPAGRALSSFKPVTGSG